MGARGSIALALAAAVPALSSACTFLVQFHDAPGGACEGGSCTEDATSPEADAFSAPDTGPGVDSGAPEAEAGHDAGADHYAPCGDLANGFYCADDGLHGFVGPAADLVQCQDGGVFKVTLCDGGCLPLPAPFPDACNPCPGQPDGFYCGRDLPGFPADNADFLIECQTSNVVQSVACANGCKSDGTSSSCYPP